MTPLSRTTTAALLRVRPFSILRGFCFAVLVGASGADVAREEAVGVLGRVRTTLEEPLDELVDELVDEDAVGAGSGAGAAGSARASGGAGSGVGPFGATFALGCGSGAG
jgi:hypothetical protein